LFLGSSAAAAAATVATAAAATAATAAAVDEGTSSLSSPSPPPTGKPGMIETFTERFGRRDRWRVWRECSMIMMVGSAAR
ncbi:hypothetical protein CLOM_g12634, partial [Closterium sp. NIES-68]